MATSIVNEIIKGRKVFFIAPDRSLFPQSFLEDYLALGYECYFIDNDIFLALQIKVEILLSVFKDSVLFFNIDAPVQNLVWPDFVQVVKERHPEAICGVMYARRQAVQEATAIEQQYFGMIGNQCGCIQLEYQKKNNFGIVENVLRTNSVMGRRKNVRAVCRSSCLVQFSKDGDTINEKLSDISLSHFSLILQEGRCEFEEHEKIRNAQFTIKGLHFRSDIALFMTRMVDEGVLYIFAFVNEQGQTALDQKNKLLLIPKIYDIVSSNCDELLSKLFSSARQKQLQEKREGKAS
ncbi:MAG: hypothetical protein K2M50_08715 [Treponemataceae bacterium]|nr:hypothetical protein [Treponema sp.]MDE6245722.1 hypothetical protein [Treponemataceae bacterium]MDE7383153.1 hypothetical protein [Treponemataceae bacterium]